MTAPCHLRVEHLDEALGIDVREPRLSWRLPTGARQQRAYRIRTSNGGDTGRVESDQNLLVQYAGPALASTERVEWQVKVWTDRGESAWRQTGDELTLDVDVPAGTSAEVMLPDGSTYAAGPGRHTYTGSAEGAVLRGTPRTGADQLIA